MRATKLGIRWTIGDVSREGFEALRLSVWGAYRVFGDAADYLICLNTVPVPEARARTGELPRACAWRDATRDLPTFLRPHLDGKMAQGAAWKLSPLRAFPDKFELSLDNDCILWSLPEGLERWLAASDGACLLAEDVRPCFGRFARACGDAPRNAGIRGLPPGFDLKQAMLDVLCADGGKLASELDEQGLQVAALSQERPCHVVPLTDVTICSPFPPHLPQLGRCGAHFCGLNVREVAWEHEGQPGCDVIRNHWRGLRGELYARVGLSPARHT